jgi:hypothetical protein
VNEIALCPARCDGSEGETARNVICYDYAFEDEPDAHVGHIDIDVNMDWVHADAKEQRQRLAAELDTVRQRILKHSISYDQPRSPQQIEYNTPARDLGVVVAATVIAPGVPCLSVTLVCESVLTRMSGPEMGMAQF